MSLPMIDTNKIIAEAKASYNQKYVQDCTFGGSGGKLQFWYLDQTNFPRFTNNLLLKPHSVYNCGIARWVNGVPRTVWVLIRVNNGLALFQQYGTVNCLACNVATPLVIDAGESQDSIASVKAVGSGFVANQGSVAGAQRVTALPTTTTATTMYVVVPTETND